MWHRVLFSDARSEPFILFCQVLRDIKKKKNQIMEKTWEQTVLQTSHWKWPRQPNWDIIAYKY